MIPRALRSASVICALGLLTNGRVVDAQGQEKCKTIVDSVYVDNGLPLGQLRFLATESARSHLMSELVVTANRVTFDLASSLGLVSATRIFLQASFLASSAMITKDSLVAWRLNPSGRHFRFEWRGCAVPLTRDPAFRGEASLNKAPASYLHGDTLAIEVQVDQPAFLTVLYRSGDTLEVLYPWSHSGYERRSLIRPDTKFQLPRGTRWFAELTGGDVWSGDFVIVVMTKHDMPLRSLRPGSMAGKPSTMTARTFVNWLSNMNQADWFLIQLPLTVEQKNR